MKLPSLLRRPASSFCLAALLLGSTALAQAQGDLIAPHGSVAPADASQVPTFYPVSGQKGREGVSFTYQTAADGSPSSYSAAGLPAGLKIDNASGLISGVPTEAGTFNVTLSATNDAGVGTAALPILIVPPLPVLTVTPDVSNGYPAQGINPSFTLSLNRPADEDVVISFILKGSAKNGVDFETLKLTKKIKAGKSSKRIIIRAADESGQGIQKKAVKLVLQESGSYQLGTTTPAKVKINYTP